MTDKQKQCLLCYMGVLPASGIDGIWGPQSAQATRDLQRILGLPEDGVWEEQTDEAVRKHISESEPLPSVATSSGELWWSEIRHFTREEFRCKCGLYHDPYCNGYPAEMKERVVRIADAARDHFGTPAHVISGLRCPQHNADSDGVANSQHMAGEACDLMVEGVSSGALLAFIQAQQGVRYAYAINSTNVHFDIPKGTK